MAGFSAFERLLADCRTNIHRFVREILRVKPTEQQDKLFELVQYETFAPVEQRKEGKGIFVASGQGTGKTLGTGCVAAFRTVQERGSLTLATAPTQRQVEDQWISEFERTIANSHPEFRPKWRIDKKKVTFAGMNKWGIITATSNRPENVAGYHQNNMTVIVDEAAGIERPIWQTLKGTLTQAHNLLLAIGNPRTRDTEFFDAFHKDIRLYHTLNWNAEESPNVNRAHIKKMEEEYGRDSDVFRVRVLGLFPNEDPNVVIRFEDLLHACRETKFIYHFQKQHPQEESVVRQFGIDLARFGSDESVIVARIGMAEVGKKYFSKCEPADVIAYAFDWQRQLGWEDDRTWFCVDAGGMGQGVMTLFRDSGKQWFEFHSQGKPFEPNTFKDGITEAYFNLRMLTRQRCLHLKEDQQTFSQLVNRQYRYDQGLFRLESKDEYLVRVGTEEYTSPDRADATALAFYPYASSGMTTLPIL